MKKQFTLVLSLAVLVIGGLWYASSHRAASTVTLDEQASGPNQYTSHAEDLNGDGKPESIQFSVLKGTIEGDETTLTIAHDWSIVVPGHNPEGWFGIVDLDTSDKKKEIAVSDLGPSGDPITAFYDFDGAEIHSLGTTQGAYEDMTFDGKGGLTTTTRAQILEMWFYKDDFKLENGKIVHVPKEFYVHLPTGAEPVTVKQTLGLLGLPQASGLITFSVNKGDVLTILGCDDVKWCQLETADGKKGWFSMHDFNVIDGLEVPATDVFDGLSMAD